VVQPRIYELVELEIELVLALERVLLIPSLKRDGAIGPKRQRKTAKHRENKRSPEQAAKILIGPDLLRPLYHYYTNERI